MLVIRPQTESVRCDRGRLVGGLARDQYLPRGGGGGGGPALVTQQAGGAGSGGRLAAMAEERLVLTKNEVTANRQVGTYFGG